jgi:dihydropteroate synthase
MGVLNCTPDSFSDGGAYVDVDAAMARIDQMKREGASIVDIGGESTRPGSEPVSEDEELARVMPVLERALVAHPDLVFSIDTTKYAVAESALRRGAHVLNDVSGLRNEPRFVDLCVAFQRPIILMHSIGTPKTMQNNTVYDDVTSEVFGELLAKAEMCHAAGVPQIILDPGIGFGKTLPQNLALIQHLDQLASERWPVLIGVSRKSMIGTILNNRPVDGRLAGGIALQYHALTKGAKILRTHDVQEASDSILIYTSLTNENLPNRLS